jgi:endonuclease YncB( thermonuclease family)
MMPGGWQKPLTRRPGTISIIHKTHCLSGLRICATRLLNAFHDKSFSLFATAAAALCCAVSAAASSAPCGYEGSLARGRIAAVDERLELILAGGGRIRIAGIDPPRPTPENPGLDTGASGWLAAWLLGKEIAYRPLGEAPDRWGRIVAFVFAAPQHADAPAAAARVSAGEALAAAGLARYAPEAAARPCRSSLLAAEARARAARLGLWADPYYGVIAANGGEPFAERAGTAVIAEGRVAGIGGQRPGVKLYFGPRKGRDLSVTVVPRNSAAYRAVFAKLSALQGRRIRVRGLLDMRFGPEIEIQGLDALEPDPAEPAPAPPAPGR